MKGKTLLITGGTGTLGNALLTRLQDADLHEIRIFSRDEKKQDDMRRRYADTNLRCFLGDVREPRTLRDALDGVDYVFHAAALKQVPSCEEFPMEALQTNAIGTFNVLSEAISAKVSRVVVISTDKAVHPINAMGISKAMMEKLAVSKARLATGRTVICVTRHGNVMASRGSVIPLFLDQIARGEKLTVTDPRMTRFVLSIEDAVELVLYANKNAEPGDIFVRKAPAVSLDTLAKAMCRTFGVRTEYVTVGARPGEKLSEMLITGDECSVAEDLGSHFRISSAFSHACRSTSKLDPSFAPLFPQGYESNRARQLDVDQMITLLKSLDCVKRMLGFSCEARRSEHVVGAT